MRQGHDDHLRLIKRQLEDDGPARLVDKLEPDVGPILGDATGREMATADRNGRLACRRWPSRRRLRPLTRSVSFSAHCRREYALCSHKYNAYCKPDAMGRPAPKLSAPRRRLQDSGNYLRMPRRS